MEMNKALLILLFFLGIGKTVAQEEEVEKFSPQIRVALITANSHVPEAFEGEKRVPVIPAWGFDVDYFFHPKWSLGLQADLKLQSFEVKDDGVILERSYPFSLAPVIHYHFVRHWSLYLGPGWEFEKTENLYFLKLGTEYSFELSETFEIALNVAYENKQEIYNSWTFGIAFNKRIWKKEQ